MDPITASHHEVPRPHYERSCFACLALNAWIVAHAKAWADDIRAKPKG
jgi:hypothetical protein